MSSTVTFTLTTALLPLPSGVSFSHYSFAFYNLVGTLIETTPSSGGALTTSNSGLNAGDSYVVVITALDTSGNQIGENSISQEFTVYDDTLYYPAPAGVSLSYS